VALDALTVAVNALVARILILEPLSIAQITANSTAEDMWLWQDVPPYWTNRPTGLRELSRDGKWQLSLVAQLVISNVYGSNAAGETTPQENAFQYIPECLRYFQAIRSDLAVGAYAELTLIAPEGLTIACERGLNYGLNPVTGANMLYIEFQFTIPFQLDMGL
jgi:hypothetical protein